MTDPRTAAPAGGRHFPALPPLSLYIHVPWCIRKCPYCDFNSHAVRSEGIPEEAYVDALLADLAAELDAVQGRRFHSLFLGGGTPSLFSEAAIARLLEGIDRLVPLDAETEITLEANPGTFEQARFTGFRRAGINRLSIGIQSFNNRALQRLGRVHNSDEALRAVGIARRAGFERLNLDLMFALPQQTNAEAMQDLQTAFDLAPDHISWYQLTLEPNTAFHHQPPPLPDDDAVWAMQSEGLERLHAEGYGRYEISAYAKPGQQSRHNLNYWRFGDYLGIGAGAHGKISFAANGRIERRTKRRHPQDYLRHRGTQALSGSVSLEDADLPLEFLMNALRLREGVSRALFSQHTGLPDSALAPVLAQVGGLGLLEDDSTRLCTTALGFDHLNSLLARLV
ncbi:radical SAM family heme chaperone HemW [Granulosicoccaceae sp. 1_MG-2023]|nr:radical SAM family heme chaperone HemW [Granulosicoccaceae sp. 1_MG-2023]